MKKILKSVKSMTKLMKWPSKYILIIVRPIFLSIHVYQLYIIYTSYLTLSCYHIFHPII